MINLDFNQTPNDVSPESVCHNTIFESEPLLLMPNITLNNIAHIQLYRPPLRKKKRGGGLLSPGSLEETPIFLRALTIWQSYAQ